jgi:hypothetical protein
VLRNKRELIRFTDQFGVTLKNDRGPEYIDWPRVALEFDAIELARPPVFFGMPTRVAPWFMHWEDFGGYVWAPREVRTLRSLGACVPPMPPEVPSNE